MTTKEVSEIKKLYGIKECSISRIAGCYVNGNGDILFTFSENFLVKEEEEQYKYLEIFKKALTGKVGKNLNTYSFLPESIEVGGMQNFLLKLKNTGLKNEEMLRAFYEKVIKTYSVVENYLILLIANTYDIPARGDDEFKNIDASDEVYDYISFYICPVKLEDGGLSYDENKNVFVKKDRRWCVQMPTYSFLFPSFEDRSENNEMVTVFTKKTDGSMSEFSAELLQTESVISADEQKNIFNNILAQVVEDKQEPITAIETLHEAITEHIEKNKEQNGSVTIQPEEIKDIAKECGIDNDLCNEIEQELKEAFGESPIYAENIINTKAMQVKTNDVIIKINRTKADKVRKEIIDNEHYLLVPISLEDGIEVNGVSLEI